jgi:hypothetical protein
MQSIDKETFSYWVTHPDALTLSDLQQVQASLSDWPYCQALYTLSAKATAQQQPSQAVGPVRQAAAYALSRNALRRLVENEFQWSANLLSKLNELSQWSVPIPDDYQQESYALFKARTLQNERIPALNLLLPTATRPVVDDNTRDESQLQDELALAVPVVQPEPLVSPERQRQLDLIENFIRTEPRIPPLRAGTGLPVEQTDLAERGLADTGGLVTESFALLLVRQGKVDKAVEMYRKLMVKNPAKNAYFAAKISELAPPPAPDGL